MLPPGIGWPGGSPENTGIIIGIVVGAYFVALWLAALVWTFRDIRERSIDPVTQVVAVLIVAVFNLPGWVLYQVLRPPLTLAEVYERQLEAEALRTELSTQLACPDCSREVDADYVACPHCGAGLKTACVECGRAGSFSWRVCPWCATPRAAATAPVAGAPPNGRPGDAYGATDEPPPSRTRRVIGPTSGADVAPRDDDPTSDAPAATPFHRPQAEAEPGAERESVAR